MSTEVDVTRGVRTIYGTREVGGSVGVVKTDGISNELTVDLSAADFQDVIDGNAVIAPLTLPLGAIFTAAYFQVTEAFVLAGTTPALEVGTATSEATNGVTITEAQLEAIGADDVTAALAGTWAAGAALAADTLVGLDISGTSPTVTDVGSVRVTVVYKKLPGA